MISAGLMTLSPGVSAPMMLRTRACIAALLLVLALSGCGIRKDIHQAALDAIAEAQDELASAQGSTQDCLDAQAELDGVIGACRGEIEALQQARDRVLADNQSLRAQLAGAAEGNQELVEGNQELVEANEEIARMLEESRRALAEARERQKAADARDAIYRRIRDELAAMIDAGKLAVRIVRGRLVIDLKQDILFPSGSSKLSPIGEETLADVARALAKFPDRAFQVEGHTDNVPIKTKRFPSNWELSTARAVSVVNLFIDRGMPPAALSAAGYGAHQPRADNGSSEGRALNRRIEIVMQPDLQLLPDLVDQL
jgi:chemotaxis protein MotB